MIDVSADKLDELLAMFVDQTTECPPTFNPNDDRFQEDKMCPFLLCDNVLCEECWKDYLSE